jgi:hypothetical protein
VRVVCDCLHVLLGVWGECRRWVALCELCVIRDVKDVRRVTWLLGVAMSDFGFRVVCVVGCGLLGGGYC